MTIQINLSTIKKDTTERVFVRKNSLELAELQALLTMFCVDTTSWGKGNIKSIKDLLKEMLNREVTLEVNDRLLIRKVKIISMTILHSREDICNKLLLEEKQVLPDGRVRHINSKPAGKICADETFTEALARELKQELRLDPHQYVSTLERTELKKSKELPNGHSRSFPTLETVYEVHYVVVGLNPSVPYSPSFSVKDSDGKMLYFKWIDNP